MKKIAGFYWNVFLKGMEYENLPDTYVIFICDYDPFYEGKYRYVFRNMCWEDNNVNLQDGSWTIFLNTHGTNDDEVPEELVKFLKFVGADLGESQRDFQDDFIKKLQDSIKNVKQSREMEERYMLLEQLLKREYKTGKAEGKVESKIESIIHFLEEKDSISNELKVQIMEQKDMNILEKWLKLAVQADSIEQFEKNM